MNFVTSTSPAYFGNATSSSSRVTLFGRLSKLLILGIFGIGLIDVMARSQPAIAQESTPEIPEALRPWQDWATWNDRDRNSPPVYNSPGQKISFWPSRLKLEAFPEKATWQIAVEVFSETWVPLPGDKKLWPQTVQSSGQQLVVVERNSKPATKLTPGRYELSGEFLWNAIPQRIAVPPEIGILELSIDGQDVALPNWDAESNVWLRRVRTKPAEENLISAQVYRVLTDGIPLWLQTDIELTVSGKSREEEIGWMLPKDFVLASVDSPIPVAVDDNGKLKAQVRSGKWTISLTAFCNQDLRDFKFSEQAQPIVDKELLAYQSNPEFRLAELTDLSPLDVTQTTFPEKWRNLPVFLWETKNSFGLNEKIRGMGSQRPDGLDVARRIWLNENGTSATYMDSVSGSMQSIWRLDAAENQKLGSVRSNGEGQLITANPQNGAPGVELRNRTFDLKAIGELDSTKSIPAVGWETDAASVTMSIELPPGWRMFALFGADDVQGDWLTAWNLLDLFLLLIFGLAVWKIRGPLPGLIALVAFGLAYHEPGAPRLTWLFLLLPLALLNVVKEGNGRNWLLAWKYFALILLTLNLVPFAANQLQTAIYPQLERSGINYRSRAMFTGLNATYRETAQVADLALESFDAEAQTLMGAKFQQSANLALDPKARIQTGPGEPEWNWNRVECSWNGPVAANQTVQPILISANQHRILNLIRVSLLILLLGMMVKGLKIGKWFSKAATAPSAALLTFLLFSSAPSLNSFAQEIPDEKTLETLRSRLLQTPDVFPIAAEIPSASLECKENRIVVRAEIHAAAQVAVPLPGRLPNWSPVSVNVNGQRAELLRRKDDYLWIVLEPGVHQVQIDALIPGVTEWEWTYLLKPRIVNIKAPDWNVSGVDSNGVPENQVFLTRKQQTTEGDSAYDRKDFNAIAVVDRHLEIGLIWQIRTVVTRLSPGNKAISLKVPLLSGESVLTPAVESKNGRVEVLLGASQDSFSWNSEVQIGSEIKLQAADSNSWIERWHLTTSPVWNVQYEGLPPFLSEQQKQLIPKWNPWPLEEVKLTFSKPKPITGETTTVHRLKHETTLGSRQRNHELDIQLESSLGGEFMVQLVAGANVSSVSVKGRVIPARMDDENLVVPIQTGRQPIKIVYRTDEPLSWMMKSSPVKLPLAATNVTSTFRVPSNRWVLWANGPTRGPAVQFWVILVFAFLVAMILGSSSSSPLSRFDWMLLAVGLTQVHASASLLVVVWLFVLSWRKDSNLAENHRSLFNFSQIGIVILTVIAVAILIVAVSGGLLGYPEMYIRGNNSSRYFLQFFQPISDGQLPAIEVFTVSVWFYRLLMLFWALWLSFALIRWLSMGWNAFGQKGFWKHKPRLAVPDAQHASDDPQSPSENPI